MDLYFNYSLSKSRFPLNLTYRHTDGRTFAVALLLKITRGDFSEEVGAILSQVLQEHLLKRKPYCSCGLRYLLVKTDTLWYVTSDTYYDFNLVHTHQLKLINSLKFRQKKNYAQNIVMTCYIFRIENCNLISQEFDKLFIKIYLNKKNLLHFISIAKFCNNFYLFSSKATIKANVRPSVRMSTTFRWKRDFLGP